MKEAVSWLAWIASGAGGIVILIELGSIIRILLNKKTYVLVDDHDAFTVHCDYGFIYCFPEQKNEYIVLTALNILSVLAFIGSIWIFRLSDSNTEIMIWSVILVMAGIFGFQKTDALIANIGTFEAEKEILKDNQKDELLG